MAIFTYKPNEKAIQARREQLPREVLVNLGKAAFGGFGTFGWTYFFLNGYTIWGSGDYFSVPLSIIPGITAVALGIYSIAKTVKAILVYPNHNKEVNTVTTIDTTKKIVTPARQTNNVAKSFGFEYDLLTEAEGKVDFEIEGEEYGALEFKVGYLSEYKSGKKTVSIGEFYIPFVKDPLREAEKFKPYLVNLEEVLAKG